MVHMDSSWGEKVTQTIDQLSDGKWHKLNEIEIIYSLPEDEREKILNTSKEADIIEIRNKDGEITEIRETGISKMLENLPEEK